MNTTTTGLAVLLAVTFLAAAPAASAGEAAGQGETLYNGIRLPAGWPPRVKTLTREPMSPPYLASPPKVIPIDVGRQLFVDDFLIEKTDLTRTWHRARWHEVNPVLKPDKPWEMTAPSPTAMVFSDGVWYDPADRRFKMWYMGGYVKSTCYATSKDGIRWQKPALKAVEAGTNIVHRRHRDSAAVWLDLGAKDPKRRYKLFVVCTEDRAWRVFVHYSADGIDWGRPVAVSGPVGDRTTVFHNPFRGKWVYSIRCGAAGMGRARRYREHADAAEGARWDAGGVVQWIGADRSDPPRADLKTTPQLYNLDAVAYESVMLGLFTIWPGQPSDRAKPNSVCLGFSRDGFHWHRGDHRPFIGPSEQQGDWNWGNVQSAGGGCLIVGENLHFYVSARAGIKGSRTSGVCSTGLAVLRRDGFASMDAGDVAGTLTTRPVRFGGKHLFVNADTDGGEIRAEVLDEAGKAVAPFTRDACGPIRADGTRQWVRWQGAADLSAVAGRPVRFRFHLRKASLYAFWVTPDATGASYGYVAAGGPGLAGPTDTVGAAGPKR